VAFGQPRLTKPTRGIDGPVGSAVVGEACGMGGSGSAGGDGAAGLERRARRPMSSGARRAMVLTRTSVRNAAALWSSSSGRGSTGPDLLWARIQVKIRRQIRGRTGLGPRSGCGSGSREQG
jgi:hypothetical protein